MSSHVEEVCHHNAGAFVTSWESRYFSEGRDNLDGDSLWVNHIEYQWQTFAAGLWYGTSPDQSYDELQLSLAWHRKFGNIESYMGYTHVRLPSEDEHDHEVGAGIAYTGLPYDIEVALDAYHSFEADGFFAELSASREWNLTGALTTSLTAILGCNQGYVADGHDGANHVAASWGISHALSESLTIGGHATYSWAIDRDAGAAGDATLKDLFHVGIGLEWSF